MKRTALEWRKCRVLMSQRREVAPCSEQGESRFEVNMVGHWWVDRGTHQDGRLDVNSHLAWYLHLPNSQYNEIVLQFLMRTKATSSVLCYLGHGRSSQVKSRNYQPRIIVKPSNYLLLYGFVFASCSP